jgi:hypothetical protein
VVESGKRYEHELLRVTWRGEVSFMVKYTTLFSISNLQEATVEELWGVGGLEAPIFCVENQSS